MKRFVEGEDRRQGALLPHCLDDYVTENNPVRVIEAFIDELDLATLGFDGVVPETTGRPAYHPATLLKIYLYGYLNRVQSSRRLERKAQRNTELMWLTGRLAPDFKTIADFRKDNGGAIRAVCSQFVVLCRQLGLFTRAVVAIDGSKFKAVNNRDITITVSENKSSRRHSITNWRQVALIAGPLSLRKSAMVLKSGMRRPVSHISSMLRWVSRSRRRLDGIRLR
jgi:transposase